MQTTIPLPQKSGKCGEKWDRETSRQTALVTLDDGSPDVEGTQAAAFRAWSTSVRTRCKVVSRW